MVSISPLDSTRVLVADNRGDLIILSHHRGSSFQVEKYIRNAHSQCIHQIVEQEDVILTCGGDKKAKLWRRSSTFALIVFEQSHIVYSAATNHKYIVIASRCTENNGTGCLLHIYRSTPGHSLERVLHYPFSVIQSMKFINDEKLLVLERNGFVSVASSTSTCFVSRFELISSMRLYSFTVLPESRICVSGDSGFCCIFDAPIEIRNLIDHYAYTLYPISNSIVSIKNPLRETWNSLRKSNCNYDEACVRLINE